MKTIAIVFILILIFPSPAFAHLVGQPPFFKINGVYSNLYPVPTVSVADFNLPQDLADKNYLINEKLNFEIDAKFLPVPQDVLKQTKMGWDFGDGEKGSGLINTHRYTVAKSYILTVTAQAATDPQPVLIQSVLINILPRADYKLPKSVIKINGQLAQDPLVDVIRQNFNNQITFDGSTSKGGDGQIVSQRWDLGDGKSDNNLVLTHRYDSNLSQVFPVLRIVDQNGFMSDSFVEIENDSQAYSRDNITNTKSDTKKNFNNNFLFYVLLITIFLFLILIIIFLKWQRSK